jgi:hypothetical protein
MHRRPSFEGADTPDRAWEELSTADLPDNISVTDPLATSTSQSESIVLLTNQQNAWDALWPAMERFVRPFEADRQQYRNPSRYGRTSVIDVHRVLFRGLVESSGSTRRVLDGFAHLGLIPIEPFVESESEPVRFRIAGIRGTGASRVIFEDEGAPIERIRELEEEVRDMSRLLRQLQGSRSTQSSPMPPQPKRIVSVKPSVVAPAAHTSVRVGVSFLDPDLSPYSVSLDNAVVPCAVVEHRFLVFNAPPHAVGSVPLLINCTTSKGQRRYCRGTWLEYGTLKNGVNAGSALTRHAINQLPRDIPLPSSTTAPDPSETAKSVTEGAKSEWDDTTETETDDGTTVSTERMPLTREMLEKLQLAAIAPQSGTLSKSVFSDITASEAVASTNQMVSGIPTDVSLSALSPPDSDTGENNNDVEDDFSPNNSTPPPSGVAPPTILVTQ